MEIEFSRRRSFLEERLGLEASQAIERMERRVERDGPKGSDGVRSS